MAITHIPENTPPEQLAKMFNSRIDAVVRQLEQIRNEVNDLKNGGS